jgi:hypothetical protein
MLQFAFLHVKGKSGLKHTRQLLECWRGRPDLPTLTVVGRFSWDEVKESVNAPNIVLYPKVGALWVGVLQVDTFTAELYSPHQITRHNSNVQAPAPKGTFRLFKGVCNTAPEIFICLHTAVPCLARQL